MYIASWEVSRKCGEDIDFSIRIFKAGCRCRLFPEAWVWHKRRTDLKKFFKQVHNSGIARINLYKKYPESLKLVTSRRVEDGGTSEVAVKCLDITWNPDSEGSCPDSI